MKKFVLKAQEVFTPGMANVHKIIAAKVPGSEYGLFLLTEHHDSSKISWKALDSSRMYLTISVDTVEEAVEQVLKGGFGRLAGEVFQFDSQREFIQWLAKEEGLL
jgi:hypothetical protein